jgi:hypothetical protein
VAVPARLARTLQQTLGPESADDLVTWMQHVDLSRNELRDFNELHVARFDSRVNEQRQWLEARFAEFERSVDARFAEFERSVDGRFVGLERSIDTRFAEFERSVDTRFAEFERSVDTRFAEFERSVANRFAVEREERQAGFAEVNARIARLEARLEQRFADLLKWSFVFWVGAVGSVAALAGVFR